MKCRMVMKGVASLCFCMATGLLCAGCANADVGTGFGRPVGQYTEKASQVYEVPGIEEAAQMGQDELEELLSHVNRDDLIKAWGSPDVQEYKEKAKDAWVFISDDLGGAKVVQVLYDKDGQYGVRESLIDVLESTAKLSSDVKKGLEESGAIEDAKKAMKELVVKYYTEENVQKAKEAFAVASDAVIQKAKEIDWSKVKGTAVDLAGEAWGAVKSVDWDAIGSWLDEKLGK